MFRFLSYRGLLSILLLATFVCSRAAADEPKKVSPTKEQIAQWIKDLGNDEFTTRENASKQLWQAGRLAEGPLKEALKSDDLEVKRRSRELLDKFRWGIYPKTPSKIVEMIQRYQGGEDADAKIAIVVELLVEGVDGRTAVDSISAGEDKDLLHLVQMGAAVAFAQRGYARHAKKDYDGVFKDYDQAIRLNPKYTLVFLFRGNAWYAKQEYDRAIKDYNEAIRLNPEFVIAVFNRGNAWGKKKDYDSAIKDYDETIRLSPKYIGAFHNRGNAWNKKKDYDRALKDYDEALLLDPMYPATLNNKAMLLASCPDKRYRDGKQALKLATQVCEMTEWKAVFYFDVLAMAYAETGEFDKAVEWAEKALQDKQYEKEYGEETRERLKLYKDKKPFREK